MKKQIQTEDSAANCETIETFSTDKLFISNSLLNNLREVIENHHNVAAKDFGLSVLYLIDGNLDKSLNCLESVTELYPEIPLLHRRIAEIYIHKNLYPRAITHLEKALELDADDITSKIWLILSLFASGNERKAKTALKLLKENVFSIRASNTNLFE